MKRLFLLLAMLFLLSPNYAVPSKTYTRAQVDSIVAVEVKQQLDQAVAVEVQKQLTAKNAEIELLVEKSSQDRLGTYITEQNNQLTRQNILITVIIAVFSVTIPIVINRQYEKKLNEIAKKNEDKISADIDKKTSDLNTQTLTLNENIKKHGETISESLKQQEKLKSEIKGMRGQVEKLTEEAEKSKEEARKAEQAAKASELFSKAYNEKNIDKQIELYNDVLKISPDSDNAYFNRGYAYCSKGDYDKAIEDYSQVIRLKPDHADAYNNRGIAYHNKEDFGKAIENYDLALKVRPNDSLIYYNKSLAYCHMGDYNKALEDLTKSIDINPNDKDSRLGLEVVKKLQGVKKRIEENNLDKAHEKAVEAMEIAQKMKDTDDDWVKIVDLKIKEIEDLQK